jgi:hypothetical protein
MSFWKPGEKKPDSGNGKVLKEKKANAGHQLSKSVMGMKFMQRSIVKHDTKPTNDLQKITTPVNGDETSEIQFVRDNQRDLFPSRRSFGGCNKFIERTYEKVLEETYGMKASEKAEEKTISEEEMLKRYESLVSLPRGPNQGVKIINQNQMKKPKRKFDQNNDEEVNMKEIKHISKEPSTDNNKQRKKSRNK